MVVVCGGLYCCGCCCGQCYYLLQGLAKKIYVRSRAAFRESGRKLVPDLKTRIALASQFGLSNLILVMVLENLL